MVSFVIIQCFLYNRILNRDRKNVHTVGVLNMRFLLSGGGHFMFLGIILGYLLLNLFLS